MSVALPNVPKVFFKLPSALNAHRGPVLRPPHVVCLDFEAELAVVIGKRAHRVAAAEALDFIGAYTCLNDISAREFQIEKTSPSTSLAKSLPGFAPVGPWLVTADEIPAPTCLTVECRVNGALVQAGKVADLIFPIPTLIEYLSRSLVLEPGDIIATGTPAGVGMFRDPPLWLQPGDRVDVSVSQIGTLTSHIVAE